jgi:hypothetical protein
MTLSVMVTVFCLFLPAIFVCLTLNEESTIHYYCLHNFLQSWKIYGIDQFSADNFNLFGAAPFSTTSKSSVASLGITQYKACQSSRLGVKTGESF